MENTVNLWTIGAINLTDTYILFVTGEVVGNFRSPNNGSVSFSTIYKVKDVIFWPTHNIHDSFNNLSYNVNDKSMIDSMTLLLTTGFYFVCGGNYDITCTLQSQIEEKGSKRSEFWWNQHLLVELQKIDAASLLPAIQDYIKYPVDLIQGYCSTSILSNGVDIVDYLLISRRSKNRAGFRLLKRGANSKGHVANYVETEQILYKDDMYTSFTQIRGSVPLKWKQELLLKWDPPIQIDKVVNHVDMLQTHVEVHLETYDKITIINLMKGTGGEKQLTNKYHEVVSESNSKRVNYIHFDLHKMCGHNAFSKMHMLNTYISVEDDTVFVYKGGEILSTQKHIIRTNCKDNLDRTNLTQTHLSFNALPLQLLSLSQGVSVESFDLMPLKLAWAENGDHISMHYTGTPSLKGSQVRTGVWTWYGMWRDFRSSTSRFYMNNFEDGLKQDAINCMLGKVDINQPTVQRKVGVISWLMSRIFLFFKPTLGATDSWLGYPRAVFWATSVTIVWSLFRLDQKAILCYPSYSSIEKQLTERQKQEPWDIV